MVLLQHPNERQAQNMKKILNLKEAYEWIWKNTNLMQDTMMLDFECLAYCVKHGILKEIDKEHFEVVENE